MTLSVTYTDQATPIPLIKVQRKVREFAALFPDVIYGQKGKTGCDYGPDALNVFGCIIGAALTSFGVKTLDNGNVEVTSDDPTSQFLFGYGGYADVLLAGNAQNHDDENILMWLLYVQKAQDKQVPWGVAVARADVIMWNNHDGRNLTLNPNPNCVIAE